MPPRSFSRARWVLLALGAVGIAAPAVGSYVAHGAVYRVIEAPRDVAVGTRPVPTEGNVESWLLKQSEHSFTDDVVLATGDDHVVVPEHELGYVLDVNRTLARVDIAERSSSRFARLQREISSAPGGERVEPAFRFDVNVARAYLETLGVRYARAPRDAELDVYNHRRIDDVPGRELDVEQSLVRLEQRTNRDEVVELAFREIPARVRSEDLLGVDVSAVLSRFETDFRKKAGRRAINIRRAASLLNGAVLGPGEKLSFNRVVGDRSEQNGFVWAPVIVNDEMEPGVGGGVCQVATTLHAAAVLGGLSVLDRRSHSRPSGYAPLGLDAAVIYGEVDLVLQNPYAVPVLVHAYLPSEFVIRVELLGTTQQAPLQHTYSVVERHDFYRRIVEDPNLGFGEFEQRQEGGYGYDVVSVVRMAGADPESARRYPSKYWPVPEVYAVGPGTPSSALPELPEGATHQELASLADQNAESEAAGDGLASEPSL